MRRLLTTGCLTVLSMSSAASAVALEPTLQQTLSLERPAKSGEAFDLTLTITHAPGATVSVPTEFTPPRWELIGSEQSTVTTEGGATTTVSLTFAVFRPGPTTLKPFDVAVRSAGREETVPTEPVTVAVVSTLGDDDAVPEFRAPQPPVPIWVDDYTLVWVAGGLTTFGLLALAAFAAARRRARIPPPPPPPREPWDVATEKLEELEQSDLLERDEYMIYWVRLSEAVREYLGRRYGFPPTELTTSEILRELEPVRWPNGIDRDDVARFLRYGDRVKFGGLVPTPDESREWLRRGFSIVELTRPRPLTTADGDTEGEEA